MKHYMLNAQGEVVVTADSLLWAEWIEDSLDQRRVALTKLAAGIRVSTVFLGVDYDFSGKGPPLLWETMVFHSPLDETTKWYSTKVAALVGHAAMVKLVQETLSRQKNQEKIT